MAQSSTYIALIRRKRVIDAARQLARSGQHPGYESIFAELEPLDAFTRGRLQDIRSQLDHLCAMARAERPRFDIPGR